MYSFLTNNARLCGSLPAVQFSDAHGTFTLVRPSEWILLTLQLFSTPAGLDLERRVPRAAVREHV
jgi:hypothetical protein